MSHIPRHFRLVTFFCLSVIVVTYFFVYSNYWEDEPIKSDRPFKQSKIENDPNLLVDKADPLNIGKLNQDVLDDDLHKFRDKHTSFENRVSHDDLVDIAKNVGNYYSEITQNDVPQGINNTIDYLSRIVEDKIHSASLVVKKVKTKPGCDTKTTVANSCDRGKCLRMNIPENPRERISQLVTPKRLQLSDDIFSILRELRNRVPGVYDTVLLTAASSNHFLESQAFLKNLHDVIFPKLKNFTLIYYDIGLTLGERQQLEKYCKCNVLDFPFDKLPKFVKNLKCYSWKPVMIKAHINQANTLVWMDASVRFGHFSGLQNLIELTKERGFLMNGPSEMSPFRTVRSMYHFFGDEPCAYLQMGQLHATSGFFKHDYFVNRAILEPWVACALRKSCMCPNNIQQNVEANKRMAEKWRTEGGPVFYGHMHRFDQSAVSLIIHKLFYNYYTWVAYTKEDYQVDFLRGNKLNYFSPPSTRG